jgi:hypothetical protein
MVSLDKKTGTRRLHKYLLQTGARIEQATGPGRLIRHEY